MSNTVVIYKAPQKRMAKKLLKEGFQAVDFPYKPPYFDGSCYFAGPSDRSIAEEYNLHYGAGILEISIDKSVYERVFQSLESRYDEKGSSKRIELAVPRDLFPVLNQYQRVLKSI